MPSKYLPRWFWFRLGIFVIMQTSILNRVLSPHCSLYSRQMQPFRASRILRPAFSGLICVCLILDFSTCRDDVLQGSNVFIAKYPENKPAAISFTFDDGLPSGPSIIAPLFMKYN